MLEKVATQISTKGYIFNSFCTLAATLLKASFKCQIVKPKKVPLESKYLLACHLPNYFLGGLALKENTTIEWHAEWHSHTELLLHFDDRFCVFLVYMHPEYALTGPLFVI